VQSNEVQIERDLALVARIIRGDPRAIGEFCDGYLPVLYRFAVRRLPTAEDADDVVQVVLSNAARRIETYRGVSTLRTWLLGICSREVSKQLAQRSREGDVVSLHGGGLGDAGLEVPGAAADEPQAAAERLQLLARVHGSLDRLPERQALALELKYVDGYSSKEIAVRLGMSD